VDQGTSLSSPFVAGLAAYLWNLDLDLSPDQIRGKIVHAYDSTIPGLIDAYAAVLSLDRYADPTVRKAILDVGRPGGVAGGDGVFDENDLEVYVQAFESTSGIDDYSRYDLNGDGYTGGDTHAHFDLSMDAPPAWTDLVLIDYGDGTSDTMDERSLTDCEILTYYAYLQGFYEGDTTRRDEIMVHCRPLPLHEVDAMSIGITLDATVTWAPSGAIEHNEYHEESVNAEGSVSLGQIDFVIDYVQDFGGYELVRTGSVTGALSGDSRMIEWLDVDYTEAYTGGQTRYLSYRLEDVDIDSYTGSYVFYHDEGTGTCDRISEVDIHGAAGAGTWSMTAYGCNEYSQVNVSFSDMDP